MQTFERNKKKENRYSECTNYKQNKKRKEMESLPKMVLVPCKFGLPIRMLFR